MRARDREQQHRDDEINIRGHEQSTRRSRCALAEERHAGNHQHCRGQDCRDSRVRKRERAEDQQREAVEKRLARSCRSVFITHGEHGKTGAAVVFAVDPTDGHEVRELPEKDDREGDPAAEREGAGRGGPAHEWRHGARNRADGRARGRNALQRRVHEDVRDQREGAKRRCQHIDEQCEIRCTND